ncbi:hypothetical protein SUGI_0090450 [Cryptomeria japonica]|uniref:uncharacterized protein LOC131026780 n=1 Tax=Cryptomeria japonica TaxID=3369 RepID=UPI002408D4B0|nr:uncharacterized protein LOC131026780 [Cryptomeria japonica]GLJ08524.1 hypothetical protein SUGI_0090450 [Cryptomeria japonica]
MVFWPLSKCLFVALVKEFNSILAEDYQSRVAIGFIVIEGMGCITSKKVLRTKSFQNFHQSFTPEAAMPKVEERLPAQNHEQFVAMTCNNYLSMQASVAATQETLQSSISKDNDGQSYCQSEECKPMEDESEESKPMEDESEECTVTEEDRPEIINTWELMEGLEDRDIDHTSEKPFDNGEQERALRTTESLKFMELKEYDTIIARRKASPWNRKSKMCLYHLGHMMPLEIDISSRENNHLVEANEGKLYSAEINLEKHQSTKQNSRKRNSHERVKFSDLGPISILSNDLGHMLSEIDIRNQENNHLVEANEGKLYLAEINLEKHQSTKQKSRKRNSHERVKFNDLGSISIPSTLNFSSVGSVKDWPNSGEHLYPAGVSTTSSGSYIRGDQSSTPRTVGSSEQFWIDKAEIEIHSSPAHEMNRKAMTIIDSGVSSYSTVCCNCSLSAIVRENWEDSLFDPELIASFEKELKQVSDEQELLCISIAV